MREIGIPLLAASLALSGCASTSGPPAQVTYAPVVDMKGVNQARYAVDLRECQDQATALPDSDAKKAAGKSALKMGAGAVALTGVAAVATGGLALLPMIGGMVATNAVGGAAAGAYYGKTMSSARVKSAVTACLNGRGYSVISLG